MQVRPATPQDVLAILPMVHKTCALHKAWDSAKYGFIDHPEEKYRDWLVQRALDDQSVLLVAEHDDNGLVAFLVGTVEQDLSVYKIRRFGFIHDLWVEPDYRHEGLGRQLMMLAIERFTQIGVPQVRLDTASPNDIARNLFASCGFRVSAIEMLLTISDNTDNS